MTLTKRYNCVAADLYNAERRLEEGYSLEKAIAVSRLRGERDRLYAEIKASGPSVADIQADDGVLL